MSNLQRLLAPQSIAVVGISSDVSKHGTRVYRNLRRLGYGGEIWGVNPKGADVGGIDVYRDLSELPEPPDVVVSAVPAAVVPPLVRQAGVLGSGVVIVLAGGFAEAGDAGAELQEELVAAARETGVRVLGPNSGGIIVPSANLAMSFLTCLDRPPAEVRSGTVGLVTQSGGTGSYVHNLAAAAGGGLAASISTGNEADLDLADGIELLVDHDEADAIAVILETVRHGGRFAAAVRRAHAAGKPVVAFAIGSSGRGRRLMQTHTAALAHPARVLDGVLASLGVPVTATPQEMLEVGAILAATPTPPGPRVGVVAHSGGIAIMLSDLADELGLELPEPSPALQAALVPLLEQGALGNPLDMGGIIGGAHRFGEVVDAVARSGDVDIVLAVSTAHPRAHTEDRVDALLALSPPVPLVHLWMAGDVGAVGLAALREAGVPVTDEPRAAMRAVAALTTGTGGGVVDAVAPVGVPAAEMTEFEAKQVVRGWGLPVVTGAVARTSTEAIAVAEEMGYPVVVKVSAPGLVHKTEVGGVAVGLQSAAEVEAAFEAVCRAGGAAAPEVLVERYVPGPEVILGGVRDGTFGPMVLVGLGGVIAEALDDVHMRLAPCAVGDARRMIERLAGLRALTHPRGGVAADLDALAELVSRFSAALVAQSEIAAIDCNPVIWTGTEWLVADAAIDRMPNHEG